MVPCLVTLTLNASCGLSAIAEFLVKSRDYVFKMSISKKLSIVLYSVQ